MRILGIDPGIGRLGWGVIDKVSSQKVSSIDYGCIETPPKSDPQKRLLEVYTSIIRIIEVHKPEAMSIEELFFGSNTTTAFSVGQARGVVLLAAAQKNIPVAIYTPLQVKVALTGYGRAEKNQVGHMVKTLLKLPTIPTPDDTADALAIALTHAFSAKSRESSNGRKM